MGDAGNCLGCSGRGDSDVETMGRDLAVEVLDEAADMVAARLDGISGDLAAREETVGEAHRPDLQAARRERLAALSDQQFGGSAADIDEEQAAVEHWDGLEHAEVDQPGLLDAGDHLDRHARLAVGLDR